MSNFTSLIFYIMSFIISAILMYKVEKTYRKQEIINKKLKITIFAVLSLAIPICIAGLRYQVGTDYNEYVGMYKIMKDITMLQLLKNKTEILFGIIIKIAGMFNTSQIVFWLSSIITIICIFFALLNNKEKISMAFAFLLYLFLYYSSSLNIVRQTIAVAIIFYSYKYIFSRNIFKFVITVLIATMFHTTALLFLPFYFLANNESENQTIKVVRYIGIVIMVLVIINYNSILELLTNFDSFQRYENYGYLENTGGNRMLIVDTIILAIVLLYRKPLKRHNDKNDVYIFMMIIGYILGMTGFISPYIKRIALYFNMSTIYVLATFPQIAKNKNEKIIVEAMLILYVILKFSISAYILGQADIIPYKIIKM